VSHTATHYTAKELAGLPGLPGTERAVQIMAKREAWPSQKRAGKGGGSEYPLTALPEATRLHLIKAPTASAKAKTLPALQQTTAIVPMSKLTDSQRQCADARTIAMRMIEALADSIGVNRAIKKIIQEFNAGKLPQLAAANARPSEGRTLSYDGMIKWWMKWLASEKDPQCLAPKAAPPRQEAPWVEQFEKCWAKPQKPKLTEVLVELQKVLPAGVAMPSYDQARHHLIKMGEIDRNKGRMSGPELAAIKPYRRRLTDHMYPGDAYTADGHCFDGEVAHPYHGRPFRPEITPVLDIASRMCVGWSVDLAESGLAVLDALRIACEQWAVPVIFYTDNGSGYKNQMMTAPGTGILARLGITPEYSRPRNPQAHGLSERAHQTILIRAAKELCTYIGKDMDNTARRIAFKETRAAIRQGETSPLLIEWEDFIAMINRAIVDYNNRPHTGLPAYRDPISRKRVHYTPWQYWQLGMARAQRELTEQDRPAPANELPDLYHPAEIRTVDRSWVRLGTLANGRPKMYSSPDLAQWHGERVQVAYSPADARQVWVRDLDSGRLLAVAKLDGNADPYFAESKLEEGRRKRGEYKLKRLEVKAEDARLEMRGPDAKMIQPEHSPEMRAMRDQLKAETATAATPELVPANIITLPLPEPEPVRQFVIPTDDREKYKLWCQLEGMLNGGIELQEDEQRFYEGFKRTAIWNAWKAVGK
jgi:putative transposase